jgi:glyoxylase-like metal-dependent hydrolase (beta-lactamase superfamily II)
MEMTDNKKTKDIEELRANIFLIPSERPGSHVYVIKGSSKNVLIDTGLPSNFSRLNHALAKIGLSCDDIHLILLTHEHLDHAGAAHHFLGTAVVAAHYLAANKIAMSDDFVLMNKYFDLTARAFRPDLWLSGDTVIDVGEYRLKTIHTPGHCSGCMCLYEMNEGLLFTGDTILAGGVLSGIYTSGNISDQIDSLNRLRDLRITELYPGHGNISGAPMEDIESALAKSRSLLEDTKLLFETLNTKETYRRLLSSARNHPRSGDK